MASCLLSVIRKQQLKQCNYSVDQSEPLTGFRTYLTSLCAKTYIACVVRLGGGGGGGGGALGITSTKINKIAVSQ